MNECVVQYGANMSAVNIITQKQNTKMSKIFVVSPGNAVVISSFNFRCAETDKFGNVTRPADCAVLHKLELESDSLKVDDGCVGCQGCVIDSLGSTIVNSEPVVQCGTTWTHTAATNLTVLSVPGYYIFELCDESAVGTVMMKVEELTSEQAALIPKALFHGEC